MKETPTLTVDAVIIDELGKVILIKRTFDPFKDHWALPGGIVEYGETVENAVIREVKEETGLDIRIEKLLGVYSDPSRDPRGHFVSVCFDCKALAGDLRPSEETKEVKAFSCEDLRTIKLAFDHAKILRDIGFIK